jgi:hypothetical protein
MFTLMGTTSRDRLYGTSVRMAAARAVSGGERLLRASRSIVMKQVQRLRDQRGPLRRMIMEVRIIRSSAWGRDFVAKHLDIVP